MRIESFAAYRPIQEASFETLVGQAGRLSRGDNQGSIDF